MDDLGEDPRSDDLAERPTAHALDDRIIVGLAALVLLAGVAIAGGNLLRALIGKESATASSSPVPSASPPAATAVPTSRPRPPREVTVDLRSPKPVPLQGPSRTAAWLEVLEDAPLMSAPDVGRELGLLPAGSIVLVLTDPEYPGWALTQDELKALIGWVAVRDADGGVVAVIHTLDVEVGSGEISSIVAASGGYVAIGYPPGRAGYLWRMALFASIDGEHWETIADPAQSVASTWLMADGPSGLLAVSDNGYGSAIWEWESSDARDWTSVGSLDALGGWPSDLVGSDRGYLLATGDSPLWYSPDGIVWRESPLALWDYDEWPPMRLLGVDGGFVAWAPLEGMDSPDGFVPRVAFSADGNRWTRIEVDDGATLQPVELISAGSTLLALATTEAGTVHAWRADLAAAESMHLVRDPTLEAAFGRLDGIEAVSDGDRAYALGFDTVDHAAHLWESDGVAWNPVALPAADHIGPSPRLGALGPNGLVLIGSRPTTAGDNPLIWHLRPSGSWVREPDPLIPLVPDPGPDDCGPLPSSAVEFAVLPQAWGPTCFGDEPMSFTAFAAHCTWCGDVQTLGAPAWLMQWPPSLWLRPSEGDEEYAQEAVLAPGLPNRDWGGQWVRVTGHYADPAAATCTWVPADAYQYYFWEWPGSAEMRCRERFVVTDIEAVDRPLP